MTETPSDEMLCHRGPHSLPATIPLVEDEAAVRNVTREALEMGGHRVLTADGPIAATDIARDESKAIDLLLTDVVSARDERSGTGAAGT